MLLKRFAIGLVLLGAACGEDSGGDGGGLPPAITNLAGSSWSVTETTSAVGCGQPVGTTDSWTLQIVSQAGSTVTFYDTRAGSSAAVSGVLSGYDFTYSGPRYPIGGCSDMRGSYRVTLNGAGTAFAGTSTITCTDAPACTVPANVTGTRN